MTSSAPLPPEMKTFYRFVAVLCVISFLATMLQTYEMEKKKQVEESRQNVTVQTRAHLNISPLQLRVFDDYIQCLHLDYNQPMAKDRDFVCSAAAEYRVMEASPEELPMFKASLALHKDNYHSVQTSYAPLLRFETAPK